MHSIRGTLQGHEGHFHSVIGTLCENSAHDVRLKIWVILSTLYELNFMHLEAKTKLSLQQNVS